MANPEPLPRKATTPLFHTILVYMYIILADWLKDNVKPIVSAFDFSLNWKIVYVQTIDALKKVLYYTVIATQYYTYTVSKEFMHSIKNKSCY